MINWLVGLALCLSAAALLGFTGWMPHFAGLARAEFAFYAVLTGITALWVLFRSR